MSYNLKCELCRKDFIHSQGNTKTCSAVCRNERAAKMNGRYTDKSISGGTVGAISEMMVGADLMKKGYVVFRALSPACFCDVIAIKGKNTLRVEVRTGYKSKTGKVSFPTNAHGDIDIWGIYERAINKCFYFDTNLKEIKL